MSIVNNEFSIRRSSNNKEWLVVFKNEDGVIQEIRTGIFGSAFEANTIINASKVPELIKVGKVTELTTLTISKILTGKNLSLMNMVDDWSEWLSWARESTTRETYVFHVCDWIESMNLYTHHPSTITELEIFKYLNDAENRIKLSTRKTKLYAIRSFFNYCTSKGYCSSDSSRLASIKMNKLSHEQKEIRKILPITSNDICKIQKYLKLEIANVEDPKKLIKLQFWKVVTLISYETALRLSDCKQLEWSSIGDKKLTVWTEKRDTRVSVTISNELYEELQKLPITNFRYCFPYFHDIQSSKLSVQFKRIITKAGIHNKSFHGIRHGTIQRWKKHGLTLEQIAANVGHSSIKTTEGYLD